jgi:competence protein ComEC
MVRRHITPALVACVSCLALCLARPFVRDAWATLLPLAFAPAAGSIVLFHHRSVRAAVLFGSLCVGIVLGLGSLARMAGSFAGSFLPVAEKDLTGFTGSVSQDSTLSRKGYTVLCLALRSATSSRTGVAGQARGSVALLVPGDYRFCIGQRLDVAAALSPIDDPASGERYLACVERKDVRTLGYASPVWAFRARAREWLHRSVSLAGYPSSALLEALLIGGRQDVPAELYESFQRTGSLHILALSGMHVTVLYGMVGGLLFFLRDRRAAFIAATGILLFYQFIAGFMPSLLRATVMIVIRGAGTLKDRDAEPMNLLGLAGIVLILMDPFQVFSVSFQLSFLAIAGMLTLGALAQRPLAGRIPPFALLPLALSLGAQGATLPLVVGQFGAYYPSGIIAGLMLVPLTTAFLWAGLAWLPLSVIPWPLLHSACAQAFGLFYEVIQGTAGFFAQCPGITFGAASVSWIVPCCAAGAATAALLLPVRRRLAPARPA